MPEDSFTDDNEDLSSFGVDSITGASLVGRLSKVFGQEIQPWEFQDDFTVLGIARATVSIAENLQDPSRGGGEKKNRFSSAEFVRPKTTPLSEAARAELREAEEQMKPIAYILVSPPSLERGISPDHPLQPPLIHPLSPPRLSRLSDVDGSHRVSELSCL